MRDHTKLRMFALGVLLLALAGCAGYQLGGTLPPDIRSIYVPTFVNRCGEPDVEFAATSATIQEFQRDGTLRVAGADGADAILEVSLTGYALKPLRYSRDRATEAVEYRLILIAETVLKERATGKIIARNPSVSGDSTFELIGDLSIAKQDALPKAVRDLAHHIVESVVEAW